MRLARSIVWRIVGLHAILVAIATLVMPLALYGLLTNETNRQQQRSMLESAEKIAALLRVGADGAVEAPLPPHLRDYFSEAYGRYAFDAIDAQGRIVTSSRLGREPIFPGRGALPDRPQYLTGHAGPTVYSGVRIPAQVGGRALWIDVAEDLSHRDVIVDDIAAGFLTWLALISAGLFVALLALDWWLVRAAFRPLVAASRHAAEIGPDRTDIRLPDADLPREVAPLVAAVNGAFARLDHGFRLQRQFAAEAAHELRTPLTILRTRLDTIAGQPAVARLREDVERLTHTVNQLMELAEVDAYTDSPDGRVDLALVCEDAVSMMAPLAVDQGKTIALVGAEAPHIVRGDAPMIFRAVRNLIENALKYGAPQGAVEVIVSQDSICVSNDGPGVPEEQRANLFRRFWRGAAHNADGAGIGLSIVQRIMDIHHGDVSVAAPPGGGASFCLRFPTPAVDAHPAP